MPGVLILGAGGMLGSMLATVVPGAVPVTRARFEAGRDDPGALLDAVGCPWVVNAIGVINPRIDPSDPASVERARRVNGEFPHALAEAAGPRGVRIIHMTTDGVFTGSAGPYDETAAHDAQDVYGASKAAGEVNAAHVLNLRCSIVGPERPPGSSLLSWLRAQPRGARLTGFANHRWNGVTTLHFARVCAGLVREAPELPNVLHLVPGDAVSKADLLGMLAAAYERRDLEITRADAPLAVDRTLVTLHPEANASAWRGAGYPAPPTVSAMIHELATTKPSEPCAISP